ncbi:cellulase family glycosylhydrolase [Aquimarina algicola]|uniref:mannan endo-1,4-beta-mannosidase n=1 Tax=Aquimarina algicola TaxID=2589995 RepID=A0A504J7W1_9FLAO|nr:cellulase family glycosylhydrolase [Aquimarina algicola]TPN86917.1 glycosyl hydrolase family 5 [Aquimarina algicola]
MTKWNKNFYRSLVITSFIGLMVLLLFGISQILSYLNTGADRSVMLRLALNKENTYLPKVIWKDTVNPGRLIEKQTMIDIEEDYLNAWYIRQVAYQTNKKEGVEDYYTTNASERIAKILKTNRSKAITIHGTTTDHNISLDFYSADGQLAVITDQNVKEYQQIYKDDNLILETEEQSDYQVMLLLEDGYWRIRHLVKEKSSVPQKSKTTNKFAKVVRYKIYIDGKEFRIKGINYYPQKSPWDMFGEQFDPDTVSKDFDIIKKAGLNTVRIFVQYSDFGKTRVDAKKMKKLKQVLDLAKLKELKVVVTLFDFYGDYSVLDWTATHRHAEQIVSAFKEHEAILAWDIKNEPDLDFENRNKENVVAWLKEMINQVRKYDPNHLVTIGWASALAAPILDEEVDFVSFHYYLPLQDFNDTFSELSIMIDKPIVLQEFGLPSSRGFWNPFGATEKKQAKFHQEFQKIINKDQIHFLSWTLYDFEKVPSSVVGSLPWRKHKQKHFGFIDKNGKKKEAFKFINKE